MSEGLVPALDESGLTWNEAAHQARAAEQPEYMGHKNCPTCEEALADEERYYLQDNKRLHGC